MVNGYRAVLFSFVVFRESSVSSLCLFISLHSEERLRQVSLKRKNTFDLVRRGYERLFFFLKLCGGGKTKFFFFEDGVCVENS